MPPLPPVVPTSGVGGTWTSHEERSGQGRQVTKVEGGEGSEKTSHPFEKEEGEEVSIAKRQRL